MERILNGNNFKELWSQFTNSSKEMCWSMPWWRVEVKPIPRRVRKRITDQKRLRVPEPLCWVKLKRKVERGKASFPWNRWSFHKSLKLLPLIHITRLNWLLIVPLRAWTQGGHILVQHWTKRSNRAHLYSFFQLLKPRHNAYKGTSRVNKWRRIPLMPVWTTFKWHNPRWKFIFLH